MSTQKGSQKKNIKLKNISYVSPLSYTRQNLTRISTSSNKSSMGAYGKVNQTQYSRVQMYDKNKNYLSSSYSYTNTKRASSGRSKIILINKYLLYTYYILYTYIIYKFFLLS